MVHLSGFLTYYLNNWSEQCLTHLYNFYQKKSKKIFAAINRLRINIPLIFLVVKKSILVGFIIL